jgi:gliding motility-associated-like protein
VVIVIVNCVEFTSNTQKICLDSCVYFYDLSQGTPTNWYWTFGNSNADATVQGSAQNYTHDSTNFCVRFHTPGWQQVTLKAWNTTGFDTSKTISQYIFVGACPNPSISSSLPVGKDTVCACKCVQFFYSDLSDPFAHGVTWYFLSTSAFPDTTTATSPTVCFSTPGVYYIVLVDTNSVGKDSLVWTDSIVVVPCTKPAANIAVQLQIDSTCNCYSICSGDCIDFNDASCNTPTLWSWQFSGAAPSLDTAQNPKQICYYNYGNSTVTYQVKLVDTNLFGFDSAYASITVKPNPKIILTGHPDGIVNDTIYLISGTFVTIDETGNDPYPYTWSYAPQSDPHPDSLSCDTCQYPDNPIADPTISHWYYVHTVGAGVSVGCTAIDSVYIKVIKNSDIYVPNAFSPNGDGHDDYLYVRSNFVKSIYFAVYDRWGEKVWETNNINTGWDGTYRGQPENNGVFGWYLDATLYNGKEVKDKGNVTLIR